MENLQEKVEAFDKATSTINKKPWAAMIIILVVYTVACYFVLKSQFENQIKTLTDDKKTWETRYYELNTELLIKNNIIDRSEKKYEEAVELIQYADSTATQVQKQLNIKR